jgi:bisphosphoglycerate-independent phosphoglycerate mutase (AlkP superfamily)
LSRPRRERDIRDVASTILPLMGLPTLAAMEGPAIA